jgi:hypothetical protein
MKTRKNPREEDVPKIDIITGKTDHAQKEEQSHKEDLGNIEKERRSKLN